MNKTRNSLPPPVRKEAIATLNNTMADLFDLFARIKQAQWNVRGTIFIGLHKLLHILADVHAAAGERVRVAVKKMTEAKNFGTADLLTDVLRTLNLQLWLLEARINQQKT